MGNHFSTEDDDSDARKNEATEKAFKTLSEGRNELKVDDFTRNFGNKLGTHLWNALFVDKEAATLSEFSAHFQELSDLNGEKCYKLFRSVDDLLDTCLSTTGKSISDEDSNFIANIKADAEKEGISQYFMSNFPGLLQYTVLQVLRVAISGSAEQSKIVLATDSSIVSSLQMMLLQSTLPETVYFKHKQVSNPCWSKLYDSQTHGLSTNRFEVKVFEYTSPTLSIFKLTDGKVYAIATDTEWKDSTKFVGTSRSRCFQPSPVFKFYESRHSEPVFCNFKLKSSTLGLGFRDVFTISGDFDNVQAIEVWGCDQRCIQEQANMKHRHQMQAERNQKVPLPGAWDDNPDKGVLEMAGFQFSSERDRTMPPPDD